MDLVLPNFGEQLDLFTDDGFRERLRAADRTVDEIRKHFGYFSVQRGIALTDLNLSHLNAEEDHTVHPMGYFGE